MVYTMKMARTMKDMGVPVGIIGKMVTTPNSDIAILDQSDYADWGVEVIQ
jgi:hypothetical protein